MIIESFYNKNEVEIMAIIGIDLGTTNSLVAVYRNGKSELIPNSFGEYLTPSAVSINEENQIIVGKIAKERLISNPKYSISLFKRHMGTATEIKLGSKTFLPEELSSFVIQQLVEDAKRYLNEPIEEAIISVPAYFDAEQRTATKKAGELAHIKVERLVNEPSAAALACRNYEEDEIFIVFDFGGGTLDISIVDCFENVTSILAVSGDSHLGGSDFDLIIAKMFCNKNNIRFDKLSSFAKESLLRLAERMKIELTKKDEVIMISEIKECKGEMTLNQLNLFDASFELFERIKKPIKQAIKDSQLTADEISKFVLVGGSSHMPIIKKYLTELINIPVVESTELDTMVAEGLGIYAGIKERDPEIKELVLTDICPFSLNINVHNQNNPNRALSSTIIKRNSTLPTSQCGHYQNVSIGQTDISVRVLQGEEMYADDNLLLGVLNVKLPKNINDHEHFTVTFTYDINAILVVEVLITSTQETKVLVLSGNKELVVDENVKNKIFEIKNTSYKLINHDRCDYLIEWAKRIYKESDEHMQNWLQQTITQYESVVSSNNIRKINSMSDQLEKWLQEIESRDNTASFFNDDFDGSHGSFMS